jgi:tetratricopeptide (TPR) repeat protein
MDLEYNNNFEIALDRLARHYLNINDLDNAITYYIKLAAIKKIDKHSPYHNLACCYFMRATSRHNNDDFVLAKEAFENGIKQQRAVSIITEYANMLVYQQKYPVAIAQLEAIIMKTHNDGLFYSVVEKLNLPQAMQIELSAYEKGIEIRAITYAHYLLILSYISSDNEPKAQALLSSFKNDVDKNQSAIGYALLGYAYQMLRHYQEAINSFTSAMQKKSPYPLAEQNIEQCKKQLAATSRHTM